MIYDYRGFWEVVCLCKIFETYIKIFCLYYGLSGVDLCYDKDFRWLFYSEISISEVDFPFFIGISNFLWPSRFPM